MVGIVSSFPPAFSSYIGPGDLVSGATAFFGVRAYDNSYAASSGNAFDLRRSSDNGTMTATFLTTGDLDTATISAWAGADTIFVSKAYDQTGNGHHATQATGGSQPKLILSGGAGGRPYLQSDAAGVQLNTGNFTPATGLTSLIAVGQRVASNSRTTFIASNGTARNALNSTAASTTTWQLGTGFSASAANGAWHDSQAVINGASSVIAIDGSDTTGTLAGSTTTAVGNFALGTAASVCLTAEGAYWDNVALSSGNRSLLSGNQRTYYGL